MMSLERHGLENEQIAHLWRIILDREACSAAEQNEVIPIGCISPIKDCALDLGHIVGNDPDSGGFPLSFGSENRRERIGRLVRCGVLRGSVRDKQDGYLEFGIHCEVEKSGYVMRASGG